LALKGDRHGDTRLPNPDAPASKMGDVGTFATLLQITETLRIGSRGDDVTDFVDILLQGIQDDAEGGSMYK